MRNFGKIVLASVDEYRELGEVDWQVLLGKKLRK